MGFLRIADTPPGRTNEADDIMRGVLYTEMGTTCRTWGPDRHSSSRRSGNCAVQQSGFIGGGGESPRLLTV